MVGTLNNLIAKKITSRQKIHPEFKEVIKKNRPFFLNAKLELDNAEICGQDVEVLIKKHYPLVEQAQVEIMKLGVFLFLKIIKP